MSAGDAMPSNPLFPKYSDIENLRNFPDVITPGEPVVVTEKIHGTNCRCGLIASEYVAGSMKIQRREPKDGESSIYWFPLSKQPVKELLSSLAAHQVVIFGEVFGSKIQNLNYGHTGQLGFRAFDIMVDGKYLDWQAFVELTEKFDIDRVPTLHVGAFDLKEIRAHSFGKTMLQDDHIREGVVVKPLLERTDPKIGRVILKYISDDYLLSKGISDSQDV